MPGGTTYGAGGTTYGAPPQPPAGQAPFGQPAFGQPPFGQPPVGQPPVGQPPAGAAQAPPAGPPRMAGSASVPGPTTYGSPAPTPPGPGTYGAPAPTPPAPGTYGSPAPGTYGSPAPGTYGSPAPGGPATYGSPAPGGTYGAPAGPPAPYGQPPAQFEPSRHGGAYGSPAPGTYGSGTYGPPLTPPPPSGGDPDYSDRPPAPANKPRRGLIFVIAALAIVAVVGVGAFVGLKLKSSSGPSFAVDTCVLQQGDSAVATDCSTPGAFVITSEVRNSTLCQDARQPWLEVEEADGTKSYRCLAPAAPIGDQGGTDADPSAGASDPAASESPAAG